MTNIRISLIFDNASAVDYDNVVDWDEVGGKIDFTLESGTRLISNCKYIVQIEGEEETPENG